MQYYKYVPLKKVLINSLGKEKAGKYLEGITTVYEEDTLYSNTTNIYQDALAHLYNGDMDKAINYVIFGLDLERNNKLLFNLCKNMIFLLSKHLEENDAETLRKKYNPSLDKSVPIINKKLREFKKKLEFENSTLTNMRIEIENARPQSFFTLTKPYTLYWLKKRSLKVSLKICENKIEEINKRISLFNNDLEEIESFVQVEEDIKVLGLIMEVCIIPSKYEWLINKTENVT